MTETPQADNSQPLITHLTELRDRLLRSVLIILVLFAGIYSWSNELYLFVSEPLRRFLPEGTSMIATDVASPFLTPFKLTLMTSIFLSVPFILHQIWSFIAPGLYKHEKKFAIPLLVSSVLLFYSGMAFAFYVVFPIIFGFFTSVGPEGVAIMTDINRYLDFILKLFFAFGIAFEIPIATFLLIAAGISNVASISEKRPYVIIGCFTVGMLITPPDVISQTLLAVPMWLLFEVGLLFARLVDKPEKSANSEQKSEQESEP
ncbi:twin-arginine translocase subunit TatC [Litoribacillus peritrichatus]|uniref:Sec-independent protein translocase protein TatC n=1 Tax=Litoribacillus peritrichatus TaxID=718191 RepID=A0ABP7MTQ1_9GAMM